jgi:colanic acid/amylovoran biosynthesis glycosyltransferase
MIKQLKVAYIVNQYPKVSHSFIRREIHALEAHGVNVTRFSVRSCESELVDPSDKEELSKTVFILGQGYLRLILEALKTSVARPVHFWRCLLICFKEGRRSERGVLIHLAYLIEACTVLRWSLKTEINHLHAHFGTNAATVAMFCSLLGGPDYSFSVHGPEEFDKPLSINLPQKIERAKFVVAISSFCKSQLFRWCGYQNWSKIHIVRCGLDSTFLTHSGVNPVPDLPQFVCVGRLEEQKGHLLLLEAAKQLADKGYEFKLLLVGDGPLRKPVMALIQNYGLTDKVEITGWASGEEVRRYIQASRAMVLPSFAEGLPVVIMEALAMKRPVITTHIAGIPELVENGVCGWLVPAGSVDALASAMIEALKTPVETLTAFGEAGRKRVQQYHDIFMESKHLVKLFSESSTTLLE